MFPTHLCQNLRMMATMLERKWGRNQRLLSVGQKVFDHGLFLFCLGLSLRQTGMCIDKYCGEQLLFSQDSVPLSKMQDLPRLSVGYRVTSIEHPLLKHPQPYDLDELTRLANVSIEDYLLRGMWLPTNVPNMTAEEMFETVTEPNFRLDQ